MLKVAHDTVATQTPPASDARSFTTQAQTGVPAGAATSVAPRPGDHVATTATSPQAARWWTRSMPRTSTEVQVHAGAGEGPVPW